MAEIIDRGLTGAQRYTFPKKGGDDAMHAPASASLMATRLHQRSKARSRHRDHLQRGSRLCGAWRPAAPYSGRPRMESAHPGPPRMRRAPPQLISTQMHRMPDEGTAWLASR